LKRKNNFPKFIKSYSHFNTSTLQRFNNISFHVLFASTLQRFNTLTKDITSTKFQMNSKFQIPMTQTKKKPGARPLEIIETANDV